jgi:hypothetical protein
MRTIIEKSVLRIASSSMIDTSEKEAIFLKIKCMKFDFSLDYFKPKVGQHKQLFLVEYFNK